MSLNIPTRSNCPIASTLDIVGDKWSLLIIRAMMVGLCSYGELLRMPEKIATNILAERLKRLEGVGIIRKAGKRGTYALTPMGADLLPVLQALSRWGDTYFADRWEPRAGFYDAVPADFL